MIEDLIPRAHRRIPPYAIDYLEHGSGRERLLVRNRTAFDDIQITPRYMRDMSTFDPSKTLFGKTYALPIGIAPVGMGSLIWPGAELLNARAAKEREIPMTLSTVACAPIETAAEAAEGRLWFQLYSPKDEAIRWDLLERARAAGVDVLIVTVDVPVPPRRERTLKSGLSVVPKITPRNVWQAMLHPIWSTATLRNGIPQFQNFSPYVPENASLQEAVTFVRSQLGRPLLPDELKAIRDRWPGKLIVKGVLHAEDALRAVELGADGVLVSNHGGRQSDAAPATMLALPDVIEAVNDKAAVLLDSGVRSGLDVLRALNQGADFVLLGRAFFYGLAALGRQGADHVVNILRDELTHAMRQHGVVSLD
jgi:isopentenyl diphosphate isomerase/L-lactate dehydrogenase-like FMN-dependent dehydrogenase